MIKSETSSTKKLKRVSRKYNGIVANIIENKELQDPKLLQEVVASMDRLIEKAEKKLSE